MRLSSSIVGLVLGLAYALVYLAFAFDAAGAGHGTGIFFVVMAPYGLGLLVFPVIGFLMGDLRPFTSRVLLASVMAIHYALIINLLRVGWLREFAYVEKMWSYSPSSILLPAGFYLSGQVAVWAAFIRSVHGHANRAPQQQHAPDAHHAASHDN
jgi:hypothetical protein